VIGYAPKEFGIGMATYYSVVAVRAEKTPDLACLVVMIHGESLRKLVSVSPTDVASAFLLIE
jgi:hypothetical protein